MLWYPDLTRKERRKGEERAEQRKKWKGEENRKKNPSDAVFMKTLRVCVSLQAGCTSFLGLQVTRNLVA